MFPRFHFSKREEEVCDTVYSSMSPEELDAEIGKLGAATQWTPEQFAALSPEDQQYVLENINAINKQIEIAQEYLHE